MFGSEAATTVRTVSMRSANPHSCAAIITLRTNGERGDQCSSMSFIRVPSCAKLGINPAARKVTTRPRMSWHIPAFVMAGPGGGC